MRDLDTGFAALADPTRRAILARLASGEATVMELAKPFAMSQPAVSRHIKVLEDAGLVVRRAEGTRRHLSIAPQAIDDLDRWLISLRDTLGRNYQRLDQLLATMDDEGKEET